MHCAIRLSQCFDPSKLYNLHELERVQSEEGIQTDLGITHKSCCTFKMLHYVCGSALMSGNLGLVGVNTAQNNVTYRASYTNCVYLFAPTFIRHDDVVRCSQV
jgi:hypothetical protein